MVAATAGGAWIVRRARPATLGKARYVEHALAPADDYRDADGAEVLSFAQAQRQLLEQAHNKAVEASGERYTVSDAVRDYIEFMHRHRKSADDTEGKLTAYVLSIELAGKRLTELAAADFETWSPAGQTHAPLRHSDRWRVSRILAARRLTSCLSIVTSHCIPYSLTIHLLSDSLISSRRARGVLPHRLQGRNPAQACEAPHIAARSAQCGERTQRYGSATVAVTSAQR